MLLTGFVVVAVAALVTWFLHTELGLALRAECMGCVEAVLSKMDRDAITATMVVGSPPFGPALARGKMLESNQAVIRLLCEPKHL